MLDPVNPFTWVTPNAAAARAVSATRCGRALPDALGVPVAPDLRREDRLVAPVDRVADGLADEVAGDRLADEALRLEQLALRLAVARIGERGRDVEVVAPARELEPVVPPFGDARRQVLQGEVRPLTGEERDGARHDESPWRVGRFRPGPHGA